MPDLTMCNGELGRTVGEPAAATQVCRRRETCFRYTATPDEWQSYFVVAPIGPGENCEHYIEDWRTRPGGDAK